MTAPVFFPEESNDLYTSGWSFGTFSTGQSYIYSVEGIHVPPEFFWGRIDNGSGDLALNLLFFSAAQSVRIREWRFIGIDGYDKTFAVGQVSQRAVDLLNRGWANAYAILDDSWSAINLISLPLKKQNQDSTEDGQTSCANALKQAGKTQAGFARAQAALQQIAQIVDDINIARLLAAIGIQESDFLTINQQPSGPGRGIFQIEPRTYGITEPEANNLQTAVNAIANNWGGTWGDILIAIGNAGYDATSSNVQYSALAGLARIQNRGRSDVVSSDKKGTVSVGPLLDRATRTGDVTVLDNTGTDRNKRFTETANGTYVRNVMDLFFACLGG